MGDRALVGLLGSDDGGAYVGSGLHRHSLGVFELSFSFEI